MRPGYLYLVLSVDSFYLNLQGCSPKILISGQEQIYSNSYSTAFSKVPDSTHQELHYHVSIALTEMTSKGSRNPSYGYSLTD